MIQQLLLKGFCYDSFVLNGATEYIAFSDHDDEGEEERFNQVAEAQLVKWIFSHPYNFKDYLFHEELKIGKHYRPFFEVSKPIIKDSSAPGDIDLLLIDPHRPQLSIAFQVKRLKGEISSEGEAHIKIANMESGIKQAKYMYTKYRFHQSYVMYILVTDSQHRKSKGQMFRYATLDEKRVVYEHSGFGDLHEDVGIYIFEINQSSKNQINHTANLSAIGLRKAKPIEQMAATTESVMEFSKRLML